MALRFVSERSIGQKKTKEIRVSRSIFNVWKRIKREGLEKFENSPSIALQLLTAGERTLRNCMPRIRRQRKISNLSPPQGSYRQIQNRKGKIRRPKVQLVQRSLGCAAHRYASAKRVHAAIKDEEKK